ncbi:ABC transporter ATP-binding protein [Clostridium rectalis]|uniref:ABC transporter ATP-binding protein n=1 Tax=Clostridium rectalis TaxID=2040295 RepID=UPI000F6433F9|nr:ABC transporter ATP-binding protein [Clostridium rectalis]
MNPKENPIINIRNLNYSYSNKAILKNINISLEKNKFYSIIGPNGSGKTTLLKNILRVVPIKKNSIYIEGDDIVNLSTKDLSKKIASVPQNTMIDFDFTVMDIVLMGRAPYLSRLKNETEEDLIVAKESMVMTSTWHLKDKLVNELSGGERQRVIIARALAQQSKIILLDEPISNLDIQHQVDILDTIKFLKKDITVIAVLHDLNLAAQYSDELILLKEGKIVSMGEPEKVLNKQTIKNVYHVETYILKNPITGKPHIIPISDHFVKSKTNLTAL